MAIMIGLSIPLLFLLVVYVGFPALWPRMYMGLPEVVRWLALAVSVAICVFLLWVFKTIGKAGAKHLIVSDDMKLATTGPYSRVRHPMYTGFFLWGIATLLFTDHWGFGGFLVALFALVGRPIERQSLGRRQVNRRLECRPTLGLGKANVCSAISTGLPCSSGTSSPVATVSDLAP
jgi:protein-S-isoprenylcysteine O-methyltransferase Ste14